MERYEFSVTVRGRCWALVDKETVAQGPLAVADYLQSLAARYGGNKIPDAEIDVQEIVCCEPHPAEEKTNG
jgi:hypothetical protein